VKKQVKFTMPKWGPFALVGVGALVAVLAGWTMLLGPKQHSIGSLRSQTSGVQQQIAADLSRAADARSGTGVPTIKVADIYKLQTAMPSATDMPDLLLELDQTAKAAGVQLQSIQPSTSAASSSTGPYMTVPISLTAVGNFYSLTDLLYRLRNLVYVRSGALEANGRIFDVNSVSLSTQAGVITAQISMDTYVYGGSTAPAAVAPTTTTPTDTTTTSDSSSDPTAAGTTP
jgi:type IV pilus assembly protein PilO